MGEHKRNPIAIAAKNGELPKKKKSMTKRQRDALLTALILSRAGVGLASIYDNLESRY